MKPPKPKMIHNSSSLIVCNELPVVPAGKHKIQLILGNQFVELEGGYRFRMDDTAMYCKAKPGDQLLLTWFAKVETV